jgi:hypothetical protein
MFCYTNYKEHLYNVYCQQNSVVHIFITDSATLVTLKYYNNV